MSAVSWLTNERSDFPKVLAAEGLELIHFDRGFCVIGLNATGAREPHLYVGDLFVHRPHRKRGVARNIVDRLSDLARENGVRALYADVFTDSKTYKRTLAVLRALGFRLHMAGDGKLLVFRKQI